ncbi:hypothetical protein D9615_002048 [Tricholomella constricta]|uniref:RNA helicase n=1 Tax=Tricholomella constricta TaxID=117010 RepID=A0A8H5HP65_9AGAR|nr:hypothetical protein D9615_002048 [Tricholomella constricta]
MAAAIPSRLTKLTRLRCSPASSAREYAERRQNGLGQQGNWGGSYGSSSRQPKLPYRSEKESWGSSSKGFGGDFNRRTNRRSDAKVWKERSFNESSSTPSVPKVDPDNIPAFFESEVKNWSGHRALPRRLESFGIPADEIRPLLKAFVLAVQSGSLSTPEGHERYGLVRFAQDLSDGPVKTNIDIIYSTILFTWAADPAHEPLLEAAGILPTTIAKVQALARAADRSYPAEEYSDARRLHRKVIMHVGPTNSGKTHNALRALAASNSGVYAGPLRLLAHEIWERLNLGQIVPLGVEEAPVHSKTPPPEADTDSALDIGNVAPAVRKLGNPKYVRVCNMRTGEEHKVVSEAAPLLSCTVEMLSIHKQYDIAVVDEIQMIADESRGNAWTRAVLGLCAKELHLCGEETAVPVVRELLKDTGDELIVNRYERLTPLHVEEQGLEGDFSRVRKGDCIVTFSRSNIFAIKRRIESMTSMRCAVVYGMLPPEIRSEQAALFNDPDSGYDVIIGSDAIGMGLNLKIRRIIFEAVRKWDGVRDRPLSTSQTKQIAGRAGRYGLHGNEQPGGFTTALFPADVDFIRQKLALNIPPLPFARIGPTKESFAALFTAMPPDCSTHAIFDAHQYISRLPPILRFSEMGEERLREMCDFVDSRGAGLPVADRLTLVQAPIPWRDATCLEIISRFVKMLRDDMNVDLVKTLHETDFMVNLELIENKMNGNARSRTSSEMLASLESFHKALVVYVWMSFRQPVAWNQHTEVAELKDRVEKALEWTLQALTKNQPRHWKEHLNTQRNERTIPYRNLRQLKTEQALAASA